MQRDAQRRGGRPVVAVAGEQTDGRADREDHQQAEHGDAVEPGRKPRLSGTLLKSRYSSSRTIIDLSSLRREADDVQPGEQRQNRADAEQQEHQLEDVVLDAGAYANPYRARRKPRRRRRCRRSPLPTVRLSRCAFTGDAVLKSR